jgi:hypothetical protein
METVPLKAGYHLLSIILLITLKVKLSFHALFAEERLIATFFFSLLFLLQLLLHLGCQSA